MLKCFKLKGKEWRVKYDINMTGAKINCGHIDKAGNVLEYDGVCFPDTRMIIINSLSECVELSYKHELIHAILYTMKSNLAENEAFVSEFSELLQEAETTMQYKAKYIKTVKTGFGVSKINLKMFCQGD